MIAYFKLLLRRLAPKKLLDMVALAVMALVLFQMVTIGIIFSWMIYDIVEKQTEKRALQTARQTALLLAPTLAHLGDEEFAPGELQRTANSLRIETEATLVAITDKDGLLISHTNPEEVGKLLVAPYDSRALRHGRPYVSKTVNAEGAIISGNAPILDVDLEVSGMVSVGYLVENVREVTHEYLQKELFYVWIFITVGLAVAILIAHWIKKATLGLEPKEIAAMYQEREAIIASIREGLIATDNYGSITMLNQTAAGYFGHSVIHDSINRLLPDIDFSQVYEEGEQILAREVMMAGVKMVLNMVPTLRNAEIHGAVLTFRPKDEIDLIARELSQVQSYSDMLRAQTHEYSNRLHTIVGLIQMEAYDEVLDFIASETTGQRLLIRLLTESVPDQVLSSFLIGKYMHAVESKVHFSIDPESRMIDIPNNLNRHQLVTILGNLLNNAIDAAGAGKNSPQVKLFMSDFGNDLIFEIEDSGQGVPEETAELIFNKGFSGKDGENRGYGLHLVARTLETLGGGVTVSRSEELGGALFIVEIPK